MRKIKLVCLNTLIFVFTVYVSVAQTSPGDAMEAVIKGLQVDSSEVEMYGTNLSYGTGNTYSDSKVLVDHSIVYEAIQPTKGRSFFLYKRIDKIVYLMPVPTLQIKLKLEESMVEN